MDRLVSLKASLSGVWTAIFFLCPHVVISLHVCVPISSPYRDACHSGSGPTQPPTPTPRTSFHGHHLCKGPTSKYGHVLRFWGGRALHTDLGGTQFSHYTRVAVTAGKEDIKLRLEALWPKGRPGTFLGSPC